jgi:hypothetical protein
METIEVTNEKGEKVTKEQHKALSARLIEKILSLLNSQIAKNWGRFENVLEALYVFAVGSDISV